ncbi:MAG: LolA-related protein [Janthinobacterium lividum]
MISGLKTRLRRDLAVLAASLPLATVPAWAFDLPELMGLLGQQKHGEANFVEQRYVRGFDGPLPASGTLSFTAPDQLVRKTLSPRAETMSVDGNALVLSRSGRTRSMTLDSMPELLGLVEAMRATLAGNATVLQRYFRTKITGTVNEWAIDLAPIDERLASQVDSLRLTGRGGEVLGVEMEFRGGDRSVMTISPRRPGTAQ